LLFRLGNAGFSQPATAADGGTSSALGLSRLVGVPWHQHPGCGLGGGDVGVAGPAAGSAGPSSTPPGGLPHQQEGSGRGSSGVTWQAAARTRSVGKQRQINPSCGEVYRVFVEMDGHRNGVVTKAQFEGAAVQLGMRPANIERLFLQ
jgi:hypothetical protein